MSGLSINNMKIETIKISELKPYEKNAIYAIITVWLNVIAGNVVQNF